MGQRYVSKYMTSISSWKIIGDINLFNVNLALNDLIQNITKGKPENVRIQIVLKTQMEVNLIQSCCQKVILLKC